jgi:hypothetical protein
MVMRLSRWHRVGIVLSIIWAVGAGIYTRNADVEAADHFSNFAYKVCSDRKAIEHSSDLSNCSQERERNLATWMKGDKANVAFAALVPIPLGWLGGFILLYISRVQVAGFRAVVPWSALNWPKKVFVVLCAFTGLAVILLGVIEVLNLYVDTQVPVALSPFKDVIKTGDNLVTVEGTWTRSGATAGSSMGYPLQTSKIVCSKEELRCIEGRAVVSGNVLTSDVVEYDVESWTASAIVLRLDGLCATEVYTIDLNTESVSGAGHSINKDSEYCKLYGGNEEKWSYQLSNGFTVYWERRQKARPLPLRIVQTFFGN